MRTRRMLCKYAPMFLLLLVQFMGYAQAPQGFSYQAVVRDGNSSPIGNTFVGVRITLENASSVAYYSETHRPQSNAQGVISMIIGQGTQVGGNTFSSVPWKNGDVFIKIEIDPTGGTSYASMGAHKPIQSVPYALFAENVKEVVSSPTALDDDPIFEVKNKAGQVVFGVYQGGVRVYVDDAIFKGARGGFAVGGLSQTKLGPNEYFRITPDSARIYVKNTAKGARGGFAVGGLSQTKSTSENFLQLTPINYFIGHQSGEVISTGVYNAVFGYFAGKSLNSGSNNTFIGNKVGEFTTWGSSNVFIGNNSGNANVYGSRNIFIGDSSGVLNGGTASIIIGSSAGRKSTNTWNAIFIGNKSGYNDLSGMPNTFIGNNSGYSNTTGGQNTFIGNFCGYKNTQGMSNVFIGNYAAYSNIDGQQNVIIGENANYNGTTGGGNVFIGYNSAYSNKTSHGNTFLGNYTGYQLTEGNNNVFIGNGSGTSNTTGEENTFVGRNAGMMNVSGIGNTFIGSVAGQSFKGGNYNTFVGGGTGAYLRSGSGNTFIGGSIMDTIGSGNITILAGSGTPNDARSNRLLIANGLASDSSQALIYGRFDKKFIKMNSSVTIGNFYSLEKENIPLYNDHVIIPTKSYASLTADTPVTLNITKSIWDGNTIGQVLILMGTSDTNTITINDNSNTMLAGNRTLGLNDTLMLIWNGADWVEISFSNN